VTGAVVTGAEVAGASVVGARVTAGQYSGRAGARSVCTEIMFTVEYTY
jgi:hypothetical protein